MQFCSSSSGILVSSIVSQHRLKTNYIERMTAMQQEEDTEYDGSSMMALAGYVTILLHFHVVYDYEARLTRPGKYANLP